MPSINENMPQALQLLLETQHELQRQQMTQREAFTDLAFRMTQAAGTRMIASAGLSSVRNTPRSAAAGMTLNCELVNGPNQRAFRVGAALTQILRWHAQCAPGPVRDGLYAIARTLADACNRKVFPTFSLFKQEQWDAVLGKSGNDQALPWTPDSASALYRALRSYENPVQLSVEASTLGTWALAGTIAARLFPFPQRELGQGPKDRCGNPELSITEPSSMETQAAAVLVQRLIACDDMHDLRSRIAGILALFQRGSQTLPSGNLTFVDELRKINDNISKHDVRTIGKDLMRPTVDAVAIRATLDDSDTRDFYAGLAA
jgi:hypothetical protein